MRQAESLESELAHAITSHQRGDVADAIRSYRAVIQRAPNHAAALHLLGLAYFHNREAESAAASVQKALALDPAIPGAHYNLGTILQALGRHEEAIAAYRKALAHNPSDAEAHNNIGTAFKAVGRHNEAIWHYERAISLQPNYMPGYLNLANLLRAQDRWQEAITLYDKAVVLQPDLAVGHLNLGSALWAVGRQEEACWRYRIALSLKPDLVDAYLALGKALLARGRLAEALEQQEKAIALAPDLAEAHSNAAFCLQSLHRFDEAMVHHQKALALNPGMAQELLQVGNTLQGAKRFEEAIVNYRSALALKPDLADAHNNIGIALHVLNHQDEAIEQYRQALAVDANHSEAKKNLALLHLHYGRLAEGWDLYEDRWAALPAGDHWRYPQPRWNGKKIDGPLLVWGEQGIGDHILYASMISELVTQAQSVVLEVDPRLVPLFARSFPEIRVIALGSDPYTGPIAAQEPIASLGRHLRRQWKDFPKRPEGYLVADRVRAAELRARLAQPGDTLIGLSWLSVNPRMGGLKSAQLSDFASFFRRPGYHFVDLQYGDTSAERARIEREFGVRIERLAEIDNTNDIDGLAALITACDLVVTVSNVTAHLAGALGKRTFVMVPYGIARIYYWFADRDDSPWYPRVHVKRQAPRQSWAELVASIGEDVSELVRSAPGGVNT